MTYDVMKLPPRLILGKAGENKFTNIQIDVSAWKRDGATYSIIYMRPDGSTYPVAVTADGTLLTWTPTATDLISGYGKLEVRMYDGEVIAKSMVIATYVTPSIEMGEVPDPKTPDWAQEIIDAYGSKTKFVQKEDLDGTSIYYGEDGKVHSKGGGGTVDAYTKAETDELLDGKADQEEVEEVSAEVSEIKQSLDETIDRVEDLEEGGISEYPKNYADEMNVVADTVMGYLSTIDNPIIIGFSTDQHLYAKPTSDGQAKTTKEIVYGLRTLRDIAKKIPFNLVVLGGDTIGGGTTINQMQEDSCFVAEQMQGINCPLVSLIGNHDGGQSNSAITLAKVVKSHITSSVSNGIVAYGGKGNYYFDDVTSKIRFILLNSYLRSGIYTIADVREFASNALSTMKDGYQAIIFSHHPLDTNLPQNTERTLWNNPISLQGTLIPYKDKIICCVNGHMHNNLTEYVDGIRFISTTCAGRYELNDGSTRPYDSPKATAYDVYVVDTTEKKIHCVRFGNGNNREIDYGEEPTPPEPTPTYTNVIPTSIDTDGSVYNGIGYKEGYRLNSSGTETAKADYGVVGFIPFTTTDKLYFKNCNLVGSASTGSDYIALYDTNFNKLVSTSALAYSSKGCEVVLNEDGTIKSFALGTIAEGSRTAYIRISASGVNANAVITKNEEI